MPEVWDAARRFVDASGNERGTLLLTGSTALKSEERSHVRHSGTGRIARLSMRPMALCESGDGEPPKVYKLGNGAWQKLKNAAKKAVKDISRELIALYAKRKASKGFAFTPDSYLQHELEASFQWEDTPDQQTTVAAVKKDMESDQPMDRLVCGDVGFGKTEVAIRAAFKAAVDGKQVAVLVPTTILALQHYRSFTERLRDFPVRVEYINRTKSTKEVSQIREDLPGCHGRNAFECCAHAERLLK